MPQNPIQFQKGMSLDDFINQYGTEILCEDALEKARWGKGFSCPKCGDSKHSFFYRKNRKVWQCSTHKHQITLRTDTLFHASNLPLRKWFMAMFFYHAIKN
jgi:ribosomal protein L37AE/L43A